MPFLHSLSVNMPMEWRNLLNEIHRYCETTGYFHNFDHNENFIKIFEIQSDGDGSKFKNFQSINQLYNGFIELHHSKIPIIKIKEVKYEIDQKGKIEVFLLITSPDLIELRTELAQTFGYQISDDLDFIKKEYKEKGGKSVEILEPLKTIKVSIFKSNHVKSEYRDQIENLWLKISEIVSFQTEIHEFEPVSFEYRPLNKKTPKKTLWKKDS